MTKKLEELLNLPLTAGVVEVTEEAALEDARETEQILNEANSAIERIDLALPTVRDLDASDKEMDDLAELATTTFKDLMDLSMNIEPRFSGPIIQSASSILGHAVTAKVAKMDKKLKIVDLQLKKARLDQQAKALEQKENGVESPIEGAGVVMDRNALLKAIRDSALETNKSAK